jgi:Septum formation
VRSIPGILVTLLLVGGIAAVGFIFRDRLSANASDLQVGDCFHVPEGESISDVQHAPCAEAHDGEVFVVRDYPGGTYPTINEFDLWVQQQCVDVEFPAYVGATYDSREDLRIGYIYPLEENWGSGDHEMICYVSPVGGGTVTESFRVAQPSAS